MIATLAFYLFALVLIASAVMVVGTRNPVHAVLYLILAFFNAAGLFVLLGAEFVAFILLIVYVGAVAVLFLFVVMMLNIDRQTLRQGVARHWPVGALVGAVLLAELVFVAPGWTLAPQSPVVAEVAQVENARALGRVLYTDYLLPFQVSGLILLVAMIGAIVLAHRERKDVRRQKIARQMTVRAESVVELRRVKTGEGVEL